MISRNRAATGNTYNSLKDDVQKIKQKRNKNGKAE